MARRYLAGVPKAVRDRIIAGKKAQREEYERKVAAGEIIPRAARAERKPWPQSLEALTERCGPYAELVTKHLKCGLACAWKRGDWQVQEDRAFPDLPEHIRSLILECSKRYRLSLMLDAGAEIDQTSTLDVFSDDAWTEAVRMVEEIVTEWEAAGSPGLDHQQLLWAYSDLDRWIRTMGLPGFPGNDAQPSDTYLARLTPKRRAFYEQMREPNNDAR